MDIKRVDNQLTVQLLPDESRALRHKQVVFQRHWYQLELRENGLGNIYTIITDGQDLELVKVRDQLNQLPDDKWTTRITNLLAGLISNLYLVHHGKIFEPYMHPNNFIYSPAHGRILTFYRLDRGLKVVDKAQLTRVYKLFAFMLSSSPVSSYETSEISDIEVDMDDRQYNYFRTLVSEGNVDNLAKYFLSDMDIERLDSYESILPDKDIITVTDTQFLVTWASKRPEPLPEPELALDLPQQNDLAPQTKHSTTESEQPRRKKRRPTQTSQARKSQSRKQGSGKQVKGKKRRPKPQTKQAPNNQSLSKELMGRQLRVKEPDMYYGLKQKNLARKKKERVLAVVAIGLVLLVLYLLFIFL